MQRVVKNTPELAVMAAPTLSADAILTHVIKTGKLAHTAALNLCYAAALYILRVSHFENGKSKAFIAKSDAVKHLSKEIADRAGVKGGMLDIYLRNASSLAGILMGNQNLFAPALHSISLATDVEAGIAAISGWFNKAHEDKGLRRKIKSLTDMSEALGFSTGRPQRGTGGGVTAATLDTRIASTMTAVEKIVGSGAGQVRESTVAKAIVSHANSKLVFAREAIKQITETDDLKALEGDIKSQYDAIKVLNRNQDLAAAKAAKEKASEGKEANANGAQLRRPRRQGARASAN